MFPACAGVIRQTNPSKLGRRQERMEDNMTQAELTVLLETLAKLVEATARDPQDAADIIRKAIPK
jgi:hypothetical protein